MGKDNRHRIIGGRKRALTRWYQLLWRLKNTHLKKNRAYIGVECRVTKEEFIAWFMANDFAGCSVDRKHNAQHYELHNMQLITLAANIAKDKVETIEAFKKCRVCQLYKAVQHMKQDRRRRMPQNICKVCDAARRRRYVYFDKQGKSWEGLSPAHPAKGESNGQRRGKERSHRPADLAGAGRVNGNSVVRNPVVEAGVLADVRSVPGNVGRRDTGNRKRRIQKAEKENGKVNHE